MILIVGVASLLLLRCVAASLRRALWLVSAGLCLFVVGDVLYAYVTLHGVFESGDALDITYAALAALVSARQLVEQRELGGPAELDATDIAALVA